MLKVRLVLVLVVLVHRVTMLKIGQDSIPKYHKASNCSTTWPFSPAPHFGLRPGWVWFCRMWQYTLQSFVLLPHIFVHEK